MLMRSQDRQGIVIVNKVQATVVAHFSESSSLDEAARCVEQLCDYLAVRMTRRVV